MNLKDEKPRPDYFSEIQNKFREFNNNQKTKIDEKCKEQIENFERVNKKHPPFDKSDDAEYKSFYDKAYLELAQCKYQFELEQIKLNNIHGFAKKLFSYQTKLCIKECKEKIPADNNSQMKCINKCVEDTEKYTIRAYGIYIIPELQSRIGNQELKL